MPDPASDPTSALWVALTYARLGLRVLPIKPGTKRPPMREWVEAATSDPDIITNWYTEPLYRDHGVGLAMGHQPDGRFIFALDVDEHDPAHSGSETLFDLQLQHGRLPDTWHSITGSGGQHLLFTAPAEVEIRNGIAGDGLDVRGEGGQIVVAPSLHPVTQRRYEWEDTYAPWEREIAAAPDWLLNLVTLHPSSPDVNPPSTPATTQGFQNPDSPAEWLRSWWQWPVELRRANWTEHHTAHNGDVHWTRPGKDRREGESAILHMPDGPLVVFSTDASLIGLHNIGHQNRDGSVSLSPMQFYAWSEHHGDLSAAARFLLTKMPGTDSRLSSVEPPDADENPLAKYLGQEIDWTAFANDDHSGEMWVAEPVIAAKRLTVLYAPAKQGKSEIALAVVAALATGRPILGQRNDHGPRHVLYLDFEMTKDDLRERLTQLGYNDPDELSHLHYFLLPSLPALDTAEGAAVMRALAKHYAAEVVVIDTMGRAVEGDENSNDTYRAFARHTGMALKAIDVAVVRTDHAGKDKEKGQRGASAKNDDADVVFRVDRIDNGWRLERTHTRVSWVPDRVIIDRAELDDGRLVIELSSQTVLYPKGTGDVVKQLRAAGVSVDSKTTVEQLMKEAKAVGIPKGKQIMCAVLKFMKAELSGPTPITPTAGPATTDTRLSTDEPDLSSADEAQPPDDPDDGKLPLDDVR